MVMYRKERTLMTTASSLNSAACTAAACHIVAVAVRTAVACTAGAVACTVAVRTAAACTAAAEAAGRH